MKHNWEYKRLGDVCDIVGRIGFRGYTRSDLVDKGQGAISLSPSNIVDGKLCFDDKVSYLSWEKYYESPEIMLSNGDVVFTKTASVGKCALVKELPLEATLNPQLVVLKQIQCNSAYLTYALQDRSFQDAVFRKCGGTSIPTVSQTVLSSLYVPIPPIDVQERIVAELDKINELIEAKREQLKLLDLLAKSIFYDTFGDPVTNSKGWEIIRIGDIASVQTGSTPSRENESYYLGNIPWVKTTEVQNCRIRETEEHISEEAITNSNCKLFPVNTILVAMYGQGKTRGQVARLDIDATTNQACAAILPCGNLNPSFLFYFLLVSYEPLRNVAVGCNQKNLNLSLIKNYQAILPPLALQEQFAAKVEAIETQKATIEKSISELQTLLDSRMDYWFN